MRRPITASQLSEKTDKAKGEKKDMAKFQKAVEDSYKVFPDPATLEEYFKKNGAIWDTYSAEQLGGKKMDDFSDEQKTAFEFYVCGWLQYYDEITRNGAIHHLLYFKWKFTDVDVYIAPKPDDAKSPITSPSGSPTSDPKSPTAPPPPYP